MLRIVPYVLLALLAGPASGQEHRPVIDMHLHALPADHQGPPPLAMCTPMHFPAWDPAEPYGATFMAMHKQPPCDDPVWSPMTDEELLARTLEVMERRNIVGMLSGTPDRVAAWMQAAPGRFFPGLVFSPGSGAPSPDSLRVLHAAGRLAVLGEVINQYDGIAPDDERMEPYWALAEEFDLPVGIHMGPGPPGAAYEASPVPMKHPDFRMAHGDPMLLEEVLLRHKRLRLWVMHAGWPRRESMMALLYAHPHVYVDTGGLQSDRIVPRAGYYRYLQTLVDNGFGRRVMFASDFPDQIETGIDAIAAADFLSAAQKADILCNNAARFLRLDMAICRP